jgi:hypothetical protein
MMLTWMPLAFAMGGDSLSPAGVACAAQATDRQAWFEAAGETITLPFRDLAEGTLVIVTNQYAEHGVLFTDGDDFVSINKSAYPNDGVGLDGFGSTITAEFDPPIYWVAADLPECDPLLLFSGGRQILRTGTCFAGQFIGAGSTIPIDKVIIFDNGSCPCIDDLHFSRTPITIDCNGNHIADLIDIGHPCLFSPDCNGNLIPDECDVASGVAEDCDGNGVLDECEIAAFHTDSDDITPFGAPWGSLRFVDGPAAGSDVELTLFVSADLDEPSEFIIAVEFESEVVGLLFFVEDGLLCADPPQELHFVIPAEQYNGFIEADGVFEVRVQASSVVDPLECHPSFVVGELSYFTLVETDLDYDGIPDACEGAPGDVDGDGDVDLTDLLALLAAWGACVPGEFCPADVDGSGDVGFADLVLLLSNWSAG